MMYSLQPYYMLLTKRIFRVSLSICTTLLVAVGKIVSPPTCLKDWTNS